jgi:hypothetical protein
LQRCSGVNLPLTAADHASENSQNNPAHLLDKGRVRLALLIVISLAFRLSLSGNLFLSERGFGPLS